MEQQKKKLLGKIFLDAGIINEQKLEEALKEGKEKGMLIGQVLLKKRYISEDDLAKGVSEQLGYPYISIKDVDILQETLDSLNESLVKQHKIIPLSKQNNLLKIGTPNPQNKSLIEELGRITKCRIQPCVCTATDVLKLIDKYYGEPGKVENFLSKKKKSSISLFNPEEYKYTVNDGVKISDKIIEQAIEKRVREIHIEPLKDFLRVRFRRDDTTLTEVKKFKNELKHLILSNLKGRGGLDISAKDTSQAGRFTVHSEGEEISISISSVPAKFGECILLRLLYNDRHILTLSALGAEIKDVEMIKKMLRKKEGIIFIAAPPLSGKTTTLYSIINMLNKNDRNIFTIENQAECLIDGINQVELNPAKDLGIHAAYDSIMKQNPDILIFDTDVNSETAAALFQASFSKCLTISTINTKNSFNIFPLLSCMGIAPYTLASGIIGIIGQKMFKTVCQNCKEEQLAEGITSHFKGRGCGKCDNTGFNGSTPVFEVLVLNDEAKKMIADGAHSEQLKSLYVKNELRTIKKKTMDLLKEGIISIEDTQD